MGRIWDYRFRRSTLWLMLFMGLLGGVGLARLGESFGWVCCCLLGLLVVIKWRKRSWLTLMLVLMFGVSCGWWRGSIYMQKLAAYESLYFQKITVTVRASDDAIYGKTKQLTFNANNIVLNNGHRLTGRIQLSGFGVNAVFRGDELVVTGKLYPGYGAYQGKMSFAILELVEHHPSVVSEIRRRFIAGMQTALPEPLAPFAMGLLVGQRATLPEEVKQDLLMVGLTHIIAVSGYNLTIIIHAGQRLLGKRSKRISTFLILAFIGVFLLLTGASASIVRAAIVSTLSIAAGYYGRVFKPLNLIMFAAAITAWANPFYVWSDLSWYLSFLAFYGVLVLAPLMQARWPGHWHQTLIGSVALESICAEIITLPFVMYIFGETSLVGLPANVLVVTMVPLAMLLGLIAGLAGMLVGSVAGWLAWPAVLLLNYMLDIAHFMANLPHSFVENKGISLATMLGLYVLIILWTLALWHKTKPPKGNSGIITDMNQPKRRSLLA